MARLRSRRLLIALLWAAAIAITTRVLLNSSGELMDAADNLTRISVGWLAAAIGVELLSYVAFGAAQGKLLEVGGSRVGLRPLTALAIAAQAGANCLPGGVAVASIVCFQRLHRRGVPAALCGWMVAVSTLLYSAALALLALLGAEVAGGVGDGPVPDLRLISLLVIGVLVAIAALFTALRRRQLLSRFVIWSARRIDPWLYRLRLRRDPTPGANTTRWVEQFTAIQPGPRVLLVATLLLTMSWVADGCCLALSFLALGATPPWHALLLSYCAAQLAAALPFTPGGLGVVEGSLTLALVAYGGSLQTALAATLLYRLISYWGLIPVGAAAYVGLRVTERHHPEPVPAPLPPAVEVS